MRSTKKRKRMMRDRIIKKNRTFTIEMILTDDPGVIKILDELCRSATHLRDDQPIYGSCSDSLPQLPVEGREFPVKNSIC